MSVLEKVNELFNSQLKEWNLAAGNYAGLLNVQEREVEYDNCLIRLQYNPERIVSTGAKVGKEDIKKRKCFLCEENRPSEQRGVVYRDKYNILVNPFPILPVHFTIPTIDHVPQTIVDFEDMLFLARDLEEYSIIYNAPDCGASAPDHMHFQAGTKDFTQTERELHDLMRSSQVLDFKMDTIVYHAIDYLRTCYIIVSKDFDKSVFEFHRIINERCVMSLQHTEPRINVICRYDNGIWTTIIFPRKKHRSSHYINLDDQIMISPGAIDMAGVMITPRHNDFTRVCRKKIAEIYEEVTL
jgi:hypothetical protein